MGNRSTPAGSRASRALLGNAFVIGGATVAACGAVGWLAALRYPSLVALGLGVLFYGLVPLFAGFVLVFQGVDVIEEEELAPRREAQSRAALLDAVQDGATPAEVARRLRLSSPREAEQKLDGLVLEELLELDVTDEGELLYHVPAWQPARHDERPT